MPQLNDLSVLSARDVESRFAEPAPGIRHPSSGASRRWGATSRNAACRLSSAARPRKSTTGGNADLLPGIKVNTDAMARTTQLVQQGL